MCDTLARDEEKGEKKEASPLWGRCIYRIEKEGFAKG